MPSALEDQIIVPTTYTSIENTEVDEENDDPILTIDLRKDESYLSTQRQSIDAPSKIGINRVVRPLVPIKINSRECKRH